MTRLLMVGTGADGVTLKDGTILRTGFWPRNWSYLMTGRIDPSVEVRR
jgi:hypothetical protein